MRFTDKIRLEVIYFPVQGVVKEKTNQRGGKRLLDLTQCNMSSNFLLSRDEQYKLNNNNNNNDKEIKVPFKS